jgi:hypothetical protein
VLRLLFGHLGAYRVDIGSRFAVELIRELSYQCQYGVTNRRLSTDFFGFDLPQVPVDRCLGSGIPKGCPNGINGWAPSLGD